MKLSRLLIFPFLFLSVARLAAQDVVLAGWHEFTGFQLHRFLNSAKNADTGLPDVVGKLYGGNGSRAWGSTDDTYGPSEAVGTSVKDGTMSLKTDTVNNSRLFVTVENNTAGNLVLSSLAFDFASVSSNAPQNLTFYYHSGDLADANSTVIHSMASIFNGLGANSDYEDELISLSVLVDQSLAPGESATFRIDASNAPASNTAMSVDNVAILGYPASAEFRVVTYNIHGGKGDGDSTYNRQNIIDFRDNFLQGEDVLCFQEVDFQSGWWTDIKSILSDYPHTYQSINETTKIFTNKETSIAILSKHPIVSPHEYVVNIDPTYDKWERHAQHVQIQVGGELVHLFHYHNTHDPDPNDGTGVNSSEYAGMENFRDYILDRIDSNALSNSGRVLALGDFNINATLVDTLLPDLVDRQSDWVDHVTAMFGFEYSGVYSTGGAGAGLSDHDAVWASFDLEAPAPGAMTWSFTPTSTSTGTITMTATTAVDSNAVEYYFTNTTVVDGSHDSGWQASPIYEDSGLEEGVSYSYTVMGRDKSANANVTSTSASASATSTIEYVATPYKEGFEDGSGNWVTVADNDYDWTVHSGGTPTAITNGTAGPSGASEGTYYLYAEGHDATVSNSIASVEASFDFSALSAPAIQFDYHMRGYYIDYLAIDVHDGTSWTTSVWFKNNQQHLTSEAPWFTALVDLSAYAGLSNVKLRFRTANTDFFAADPAIDNICIDELSTISYSQWEATAFAAAPSGTDTSLTGNPDMDDYDNEGEWVFGTDPLAMDSPMKEMTHDLVEMTFDYTRRKSTGRNVFAQWSPNLTPLSWLTSDLTEEVAADDGEVETVTVTVPMDTDQKFIRVKAESN
ncbi:MAG: endonuclease/exonuclease/phosphatase family protein [Lentimonas sp.]